MKAVLFLIISILARNTTSQCSDGWSSYNGHCYYVTNSGEEFQLTWHEARDLCLDSGAELASIDSIEEEQHILGMVGSNQFEGDLWIGLNKFDDYTEDYEWSDGTAGTYRAWAEGQPNEDQYHKCAYFATSTGGDCFIRYDGKDAIGDLLYNPEDADGVNTKHFGSRDEDGAGIEWCESECRNWDDCAAYTFYSNFGPDNKGDCVGRTDYEDVMVSYLYAYAGERTYCAPSALQATSGLWFNNNCGMELGVVCKKPEGIDYTPPTTALQDSYCPEGYFRVGDGNKCYKVEVFDSDQPDRGGRTWDEAVQLCREGPGLNPDLASVSNAEENSMIISRVQGYVYGAWLGLHFEEVTGSWIWTDNVGLTYQNWGTQRNNGENCVEMHANEDDSISPGSWAPISCSYLRGYACQTFKDPENPVDTQQSTTPNLCPSGWTPDQYACYKLDTTLQTFDEAENHCKNEGGHLVSVHSAWENGAVHVMAADYLPMWIGFKQNEGGEFKWTDGTIDTYTQWAAEGINGGEGCVEMKTNGNWNNTMCYSSNKRTSMCKRYTEGSPILTTPLATEGVCPSELWKEFGSSCYYFNGEDQTPNWDDALEDCKYLAGRNYVASLVSIHSVAEHDMLVEEMKIRIHGDAFIGLTRDTPTEAWRWEDGSPVDYEVWAPNEPNNNVDDRLCVRMGTDSFAGSWDDVACTEQGYYICKAEKIPNPTSPSLPPPGGQVCPGEEWEPYGDRDCFLFKPNHYLTWEQASTECTKQNGQLASIHSTAENWWVYQRLNDLAELPEGNNNYWLGLYKEGPLSESVWKWMDGTPYDYSYWSYGEPNDETGTENCVEMWLDSAEWNDHRCSEPRGYVCRVTVEPASTEAPATTTGTPEPPPSLCPDSDWVLYEAACYLLVNATMDWREAQWECEELGFGLGSLTSIHSVEENDFLQATASSALNTGAVWIGLYRVAYESFRWSDNSSVDFVNWSEGHPTSSSIADATVMDLETGSWNSSYWSEPAEAFICKWTAAEVTPPAQPQYLVELEGALQSGSGEDFSQSCIVQYAAAMNERTLQMIPVVNDRIGIELCSWTTVDQLWVASASSPFYIQGSQGQTFPTFYLGLGSEQTMGEISACALNISSYLQPHANWGEPILPVIPGCPEAQFLSDQFSHLEDRWLCLEAQIAHTDTAMSPDVFSSNSLNFAITFDGSFYTESGDVISLECLNTYNTDFNAKTYAMAQQTNALLGNELCQGHSVQISISFAYLIVEGSEGISFQSYALVPSANMLFSDMYACAAEVAGHVGPHSNWPQPIIPQQPGCPKLLFSPELFSLASKAWQCVDN